jgi:hypothetical protein
MKKLTAMLLTLCFCVAIVGCGDETKTTKKETTPGGTTKATTTSEKK